MEKNYSINEQQLIEIDILHDETWKFDGLIKNLEILLEKSSVNRGNKRKNKRITSGIRM